MAETTNPTTTNPLALPTDTEPPPPEFDPVVGEEAFRAKEPALRALKPEQVILPNCSASATAVAALRLVGVLRAPERSALLALIPADLMRGASVDELEQVAWALWFVHSRCQSLAAIATKVTVDVNTVDESTTLRARMLRVLDYHFENHPGMQSELADIRSGQGYQDMATDLTRLAGHYNAHKDKLSVDKVRYDPADEARARAVAKRILKALMEATKGNDIADLRNRAWTKVVWNYSVLKAAADFIWQGNPRELALFPSLRTAALAMSPGGQTAAEPPAAPVDSDPPAAHASPGPARTPAAPGMPGGNPLAG
jgi:hypothetical protein